MARRRRRDQKVSGRRQQGGVGGRGKGPMYVAKKRGTENKRSRRARRGSKRVCSKMVAHLCQWRAQRLAAAVRATGAVAVDRPQRTFCRLDQLAHRGYMGIRPAHSDGRRHDVERHTFIRQHGRVDNIGGGGAGWPRRRADVREDTLHRVGGDLHHPMRQRLLCAQPRRHKHGRAGGGAHARVCVWAARAGPTSTPPGVSTRRQAGARCTYVNITRTRRLPVACVRVRGRCARGGEDFVVKDVTRILELDGYGRLADYRAVRDLDPDCQQELILVGVLYYLFRFGSHSNTMQRQ